MSKPLGPKSLVIREAIKAHPNKGNKEIAEFINDSHDRMDDKIKVTPQDVAQQKQALKKAGGEAAAPTPAAKPAPSGQAKGKVDGPERRRRQPHSSTEGSHSVRQPGGSDRQDARPSPTGRRRIGTEEAGGPTSGHAGVVNGIAGRDPLCLFTAQVGVKISPACIAGTVATHPAKSEKAIGRRKGR